MTTPAHQAKGIETVLTVIPGSPSNLNKVLVEIYGPFAEPVQIQLENEWCIENTKAFVDAAILIAQIDGNFAAYPRFAIIRVAAALGYVGINPTIRTIYRYIFNRVDDLTEQVLALHLLKAHGSDWERLLLLDGSATPGKNGLSQRLEAMIKLYMDGEARLDLFDGLVKMAERSKDYHCQMIQVIEPLLDILGTGEIGEILSKDFAEFTALNPGNLTPFVIGRW